MRIFLAVFPPPASREWAFAAEDRVKRAGATAGLAPDLVSWVKRENLHYTLSFLGELEADGVARASAAARAAVAGQERFHVTLGGFGAFPSARRARVLWLGLSWGGTPFTNLARRVETSLIKAGFQRDSRPFTPHLTLGRVRDPRHDWTAALEQVSPPAPSEATAFEVRGVSVVKSTLSPGGSRYEVVSEAALS
jgi:2'-5' RNA ligase